MINNPSFTAPTGDSNKLDAELVPAGFQPCTLIALCDVGTQSGGKFGPKHKVKMMFEFPNEMRVFYEGDDPKPCAIFETETFSMNSKANLRTKFVQPMLGRNLSDEEAKTFDIGSLLGKHFVANISHTEDGKYANISSIAPLTAQNMAISGLQQPVLPIHNSLTFYHLSQGFDTPAFANLPKWVRNAVMESEEGKAFALGGGKFAEAVETTNNGGAAPTPPGAQASSKPADIEMIDKTVTFDAYIAAGWTVEQMIEHGKAKRITAAAPPTPVAPTPPTPPAAPAQKVLVLKDGGNIQDWYDAGWTDEQIVQNGHGTFQ